MNIINISNITIPNSFRESSPKEYKLNRVRKYVKEHNEIDTPIVLNNGLLIDGYIRYLVAKEFGIEEIPYVETSKQKEIQMPVMYITGVFDDCNKEYTWKVIKKNLNIEIGDKVLVETKYNNKQHSKKVVTVVDIFLSDDAELLKHKSVIKKLEKNI